MHIDYDLIFTEICLCNVNENKNKLHKFSELQYSSVRYNKCVQVKH